MGSLATVAVVLIAMGVAIQNARRQGVAARPLMGWSLLIAAVVLIMMIAGGVALKYLGPKTGLAILLADMAVAFVVAIRLSKTAWRRLKSRPETGRERQP